MFTRWKTARHHGFLFAGAWPQSAGQHDEAQPLSEWICPYDGVVSVFGPEDS
ncbi:hypothetical protein H8702_01030 [Massilimaliae timonensis]|uniref:Uncharacterized protein n=1 Tax=Massiliimalia timonensis TaxID=1987501 RepID=A0A8J6TTD1_9FIRM|nr:hypothetical protein [Massiliimalia timonensis]MBC8609703.1 hypothetical protein [Massiliimalia timonensis]